MNFGQKIITFLSHHFEEFVYVNVALVSTGIAIYLALSLRRQPIDKQIRSFVDTAIMSTLTFLFIFGSALTIAIYWNNYKSPFIDFDLHDEIDPRVHWVKEELSVFIVNERELITLKLNGSDQETIFTSDDRIRDFQFSPDGKYILIATYQELFVFDAEDRSKWIVDTVKVKSDQADLKGTISGMRWSPDSKYFTYEVSRWSRYSSQDNIYVYDVGQRKKRSIKTPTRKLSSLLWDTKGENLYFLKQGSQELEEDEIIYKVRVFRIDLENLKVHPVTDIAMDKAEFPVHHLEILGIDLYKGSKGLHYGRIGEYSTLESPKGGEIGIDKYDYFFYKHGWFRKRLFKVKREVDRTKRPTRVNTYGEHLLQQIRWTPSGRYVIMDHPYWGILILDPKKRQIGQLYPFEVSAFGWYEKK